MQFIRRVFQPVSSGLAPRFVAGVVAASAAATLLAQTPITITPGVQAQTPPAVVRTFIAAWDKSPHVTVNVPKTPGKIVILKFSDWECPGCRYTALTYKTTLAAYAGKIVYVERDYPLNSDCNPHMTAAMHPAACAAAVAMRLARPAGKADALAAWLFEHQGVTANEVRGAAMTIAGLTNFDTAYSSVLPAIRKDTDEAAALDVRGTPAYFVNGIAVRGFKDGKLDDSVLLVPDLFDAAVQRELQKIR